MGTVGGFRDKLALSARCFVDQMNSPLRRSSEIAGAFPITKGRQDRIVPPGRRSIQMIKTRYVVDALVVAVAVGAGVFFLSKESPPEYTPSGYRRPAASKNPWKASPERDAEVNADFRVESARSDNAKLAGTGTSADWPQFNGRRRDNKSSESGLLKSWPEEGPPLNWICRGVGEGYSTVAVADGVIYTMGNKGESEALMALDAGTGEKLWSTPFAASSQLSAGNGPRGTPTIGEDAVFAIGGNGDLVCCELDSGKIRWQTNLLEDYAGYIPTWGICESPLLDEGRLICTPGGDKATLVALDPQSGKLIWKSLVPQKDRAGYASACVAEIAGVKQYVQFTASGTVGVRAEDGKFLWREDTAANQTANCSSPLVSGNFVFSASGYGTGGALVKLASGTLGMSAELVYHTKEMYSHHGDMVIVDGLLFGSSDPGILTCLDLESGDVKWRSRAPGKGSLTFADGRLYVRAESGTVALVEATGTGYQERGRFQQPERSKSSAWAHPVVAAGRLFLRDQDVLLCYDVKAPETKP